MHYSEVSDVSEGLSNREDEVELSRQRDREVVASQIFS